MIELDGNSLSLESFFQIVDGDHPVSISKVARSRITASRKIVEQAIRSGRKIYSINTGFGILSRVLIQPDQLETLQERLVRSHCAAVGERHTEREARAMLLLRANVLAKGMSGVRLELVDLLVEMLNRKVHPLIPEKGSVGASGDLAPLAHLAAVVIGEGEACFQGKTLSGKAALHEAGLSPLRLAAKEGLSLMNGTQQMTAQCALAVAQSIELSNIADWICSATLDGILGTPRAFSEWVHEARPHTGQRIAASNLRRLMEDSDIYLSHRDCDRVQDAYSLRCAPQVHGACRDLIQQARETVVVELNAATDNPLVNPETGDIVSCGNFHGQPLAFALDILGMAVAELSSISERRIVKLLNPVFSELPTFLVKDEGLNSGFMITQYTAASLVSENKLHTHPASTDSIPTNNDKEDLNSMGPIAARKLKRIIGNTRYVLAIEALAACQALEFRKPLKPGRGPRLLFETIRKHVPSLEEDRVLSPDIEFVARMIESGDLHRTLSRSGLLEP
jgi:histidine ammonia-lyase